MTEHSHNAPENAAYTPIAKALHWILAAVFVVQVILAKLAERAAENDQTLDRLALLSNHKSLGLTAILFVILRIAWRLTHRPPALPASMSGWQRVASHASHLSLYALMIALPVSGWIIAATSTYGLSWFNLFEIPRILQPSQDLHHLSEEIHEILGNLLLILLAVHVAAAAFHHLIVKDNVLKRMSTPITLALFAVLTGGLLFALTPGADSEVTTGTQGPESASVDEPVTDQGAQTGTTLAPERWTIDYEQSFIRFTGEQAGAEFSGLWTEWRADMRFDPDTLAVRFDVEIDVDYASTDDDERDATIKDSDWFDVAQFPIARFELNAVDRETDGSYSGIGSLTIKDRTIPTEFTFEIDTSDEINVLTGRARLDRLELGVGTGEWADTSWVGQYVDVDVQVIAEY